ncbi:NAD(P)-binding protein [bacterium]|nr:NAD(P)-binding protein [bacterium]
MDRGPRHPEVVVVGAGLAGLACAVRLHAANVRCLVLEASDDVGGRVRTDEVEGFRLDRGFQVLLTAYPEARAQLDLDALDLQPYRPGALIRRGGRFHALGDPFRRPSQALHTLTSPVGSLTDKLRVGLLRRACLRGDVARQMSHDETTTLAFLEQRGFSETMIEGFFRPFLGGVFLDPDLQTSSRMLRFVMRMFASGQAAVPALGMGAIPRQLAERLPRGTVRLGATVVEVSPGRVVLAGGEVIETGAIVVATDGETAAGWLPDVTAPRWNATTCLYFVADTPPVDQPILVLDGDGQGPVNNLCVPTVVAPAYGPPDATLISATVLGGDSTAGDLVARVRRQLADWFGPDVEHWRHLRTYHIPRALPRQEPGWLDPPERPVRHADRLYATGDHLDTASTNGALAAGRRAAAAVLEDRAARA